MNALEEGNSFLSNKENIYTVQRSKVRQGIENRQRILEAVKAFPVITASLIEYETGIKLKTIQHQLTRLAADKSIGVQSRGIGEEHLYRWKGLKPVKLLAQPHMISCAESWAALRKAVPAGWRIEDGLLRKFETARHSVVPDIPFLLRSPENKRFDFLWEEDLNSMLDKDECLSKYQGAWHFRNEFCFLTKGANKWGIERLTVLTCAPNERRMQELRETARAAHPEGKISKMFLFTTREKWSLNEPEKLYSDIWVGVKDDTPRHFWK